MRSKKTYDYHWYHASSFEGTTEIVEDRKCLGERCFSGDNWRGPFASFEEAQKDAILYHEATKSTAQRAIKELKKWVKPAKRS